MQTTFTLLENGRQSRRLVRELEQLSARSRSVEELVLGWVSRGKKLFLAQFSEGDEESISCSFMIGHQPIAVAHIPGQRLLDPYPNLSRPTEAVIITTEAVTPELSWFEQRNAQMGITLDATRDMNRVPARAFGGLTLSYATTPDCFAEVSALKPIDGIEAFKLNLVLLKFPSGNEDNAESGWFEHLFITRPELEEFIPRAYWI